MKAIRIFEDKITAGGLALPKLRLYADSAIGRDVMPLFIPDIPGGWHARVCVAVRVCRLGKDISTKFAMRYVDAISLVVLLLPDTDEAAWDRSGTLALLDSAVTTGRWHECDPGTLSDIEVEVASENRTFPAAALDIATRVNEVSRMATLRTGDILIIDSTGIDLPLRPDTHIHAAIGPVNCLSLKVK